MRDYFLGEGKLTPGDAAVALIVTNEGRYLLQLRSQRAGIFYPGHWGLFGGATDKDEVPEETLRRELREELALELENADYFTEFTFDFGFCNLGRVFRKYYLVHVASEKVKDLRLGEGSDMAVFEANDLLKNERVVPYDAFAIWMHATQRRN